MEERGHGITDGVGSDDAFAEEGHNARHQQLADLEHTVFQTVGDALTEDQADHGKVELGMGDALDVDGGMGVEHHPQHDDGSQNAGQKGSSGRAGNLHLEAVD